MINLLPPKEKEELLLDKNKKIIIVLGNVAVISVIFLILILIILKFYILQEAVSNANVLSDVQQNNSKETLLLKEAIDKYNKNLTRMNAFYSKETYLSSAIKEILNIQRPSAIHFGDLFLEKDETNTVKISITGVSDDREDLLVFKNNIENNKNIKNIYFSPNSWIKPKYSDFYLTFEFIANNEKPK